MADPTRQRCRWAEPTIAQVHPFWLAADKYPWTCRIDRVPRALEDTSDCQSCERFTPAKPRVRLTYRTFHS